MTYGEYMLLSARQGDIEAVKECLAEDVPINYADEEMGNTALHLASANGVYEIVLFLLSKGADSTVQNKSLNTPLHWAALCGHLKVVQLLCEHALTKTTENGKIQTCNMKNEFGRVPFQEALQCQKTEIAEYLA